ncbi:MAG TPA: cytochrome c1 [Rhodopila sp.]|uniref:cytochrome c1 n=1 Tax=Rhodopila sp. TaxID=2480087 RepID=UPI002C83C0BF|nr:cytochrome c1 [Rhodopila sp.]HVY15062.1 cytochrome c1 [Rhodopila sp.]
MSKLRSLIAGAFAAGLLATAAMVPAAHAQEEQLPHENWSFNNLFGTYDLAAAQRGFQVYSQICSNCHSMQMLHYRDLAGIGLSPEQIKAVAAAVTVPQGVDDQGNPKEGPATPADEFRSPFPNPQAARAANGGALPPDLSLIVNAREGHANYVYGILTGFTNPPAGFKMQDGMHYNKMFPGHQIAMPQPLQDGSVDYTDGTPNNLAQEAHDVVTFLAWASNPELTERKQMGVRVILFLMVMTGLTYAVKRKVWADVEH